MEESGSEGLDDLVFSKKDTFLKVTTVYIYSDMGETSSLDKSYNFPSTLQS